MALIDHRLIAIFYICCLLFPRGSNFLDIMDQCPIGFKDLETLHLQLKPSIRDNEPQNVFNFGKWMMSVNVKDATNAFPAVNQKLNQG